MKKKPNILVDAIKLFVITVFAGLLLGGVHYITSEPIAQAEADAKAKAYREVLPQAKEFVNMDEHDDFIANCEEIFKDYNSLEGVTISAVLEGKIDAETTAGYVILTNSSKSYGGNISLAVGLDKEGIVTGISVLSINDTPGLGMKAKDEEFRAKFVGKDTSRYIVVKFEPNYVEEIDAISSATITSKAFTAAVNGAKLTYELLLQEGEADE